MDLITNPDISVFGKLLSKTIRSLKIASNINWVAGFNLKLRELLQKKLPIIIFPFQYHNFDSLLFEVVSLGLVIIYQSSSQNDEILKKYSLSYQFDFHSFNEDEIQNVSSFLIKHFHIAEYIRDDIYDLTTANTKVYEEIYNCILDSAVLSNGGNS